MGMSGSVGRFREDRNGEVGDTAHVLSDGRRIRISQNGDVCIRCALW